MVEIEADQYDGGSSGDGNLTQVTQFPNDGTANRVMDYFYDWRDRLVATKQGVQASESDGTHRPIVYYQYDNLSEVVTQEQFDGDGVTITSTAGVPNPPSSSLLRAKTTTLYDNLGEVYQSNVWSVNPTTGAVSTYALHTDAWYDLRGNIIKVAAPGGLVTKTAYDGADRPITVYTSDGGGDPAPGSSGSWANAGNVTGDTVLEQVETGYDADSNVVTTVDRQRDDTAAGTGDLRTSLTYSTVADGGFESPALTSSPHYQYYPAGTPWTFTGTSGISANGTTFTSSNPSAPEGTQVAFLQEAGSMSQSITLTAGSHVISFYAAHRGTSGHNGSQTVRVLVDGTSVGDFTPSGTSYQLFTSASFTATPGTHTITFEGLVSTSDVTAFIDKVQVGTTAARTSYAGAYYDPADRVIASVDVGTNGGVAWTLPSSVPSRSDSVLVTSTTYNAAGWVATVTDPRGIVAQTTYDALGRTTQTIEDYTGAAPSDEADKTTQFTYDGDDHLLTNTLVLPGGGQETTEYVYGISGSMITSNDLLAAVYYPDPTTGAASSSQADTYTYNALGETTSSTDRNGTTHDYTYDVLGRQTADAVATLGTGVDGAVMRLETAYDSQGNPYLFTSYDAASGGDIVNQVLRQFNGLGQLTAEYQSHSGAATTGGATPVVQYTYTEMSGGANNSRLTSLSDPGSGDLVNYSYGTSGGLNDTISRLTSITDSTGTLVSYAYLGLGTVV
jgi:YD repeat-containing protein